MTSGPELRPAFKGPDFGELCFSTVGVASPEVESHLMYACVYVSVYVCLYVCLQKLQNPQKLLHYTTPRAAHQRRLNPDVEVDEEVVVARLGAGK